MADDEAVREHEQAMMREWAASVRSTQRQLQHARKQLRGLTRAEAPKLRRELGERLGARLDAAEAALQCPPVVQWLQANPVHRPQVPAGIPEGNVCRKCGAVKPDAAFFFDDGRQSGYTGRCSTCRGRA